MPKRELAWFSAFGAIVAALLFAAPGPIETSCNPFRLVTAANTNPTLIATGHRQVSSVALASNAGGVFFFHIYDKATAPNTASDTPVQTYGAANVAGGTTALALTLPINLINGLGIAASANVDGTGNTAASAIVNVCWQ
jgi:hypothetical protein